MSGRFPGRLVAIVVFTALAACRRVEESAVAAPQSEPLRGASIVFTGDVLLADGALPLLKGRGYDAPLAEVRPLLRGDVVIGNAEGPITTRTKKHFPNQLWHYNAAPEAAPALARAGFHAFSVANNHMLDRGPEGLLDSFTHLQRAGLQVAGAGKNEREARRAIVVETPAGRIAILPMTQKWSGDYVPGADTPGALIAGRKQSDIAIQEARAAGARWVVPYVHWGANYKGVDRHQRKIAARLAAAGADLIVGHHPHVIQEVEVVAGVPVFWSLGNFVFGTPGRFTDAYPGFGAVLRLDVSADGSLRAELRCVDVDNRRVRYVPRPCTADQSAKAFSVLGPAVDIDGDVARWDLTSLLRSGS